MPLTMHTLTLEVKLQDATAPIDGTWRPTFNNVGGLAAEPEVALLGGRKAQKSTYGVTVLELPASAELEPPTTRYVLHFASHELIPGTKKPVLSFSTPPFLLASDLTLPDIMALEDIPYTPSLVAQAEAARDAADVSAGLAEAFADDAEDAAAVAVAVGNTNDTIIASRVNDVASATRAALNARYAAPLYGNLIDRPSPAQNLVYFAIDDGRAFFAVPNGLGGYTWESVDGVDPVKDFGAKGDGTADDTAAIQAAIDAASVAGRPAVVWFPSSGGPGAYKITNTINVALAQAGTVLASPARSGVGQGARFVWGGAANGTMLSLAAERIQVANLGFDGNDSAATLIQAGSKRGLQLINVEGRKWTGNNSSGGTPVAGAGLVLGNGGANLNEFYCSGLRLQGSVAGSVGILISTSGTEIMQFVNTSLGGATADPGLLRWIESNTNIVFHGLIMDDGAMTDYAIKSNAGFVQLLPFASETPKLLWTAAAGRTGLTILRGDARSLAPGVGEYAVVLQGQGHFRLEGVRFQRKSGALVRPDVQIGSSVLGVTEEAIVWESVHAGTVRGAVAAVDIVTGGDLVLKIDGGSAVTTTLASADTPAAVVAKVNTALGAAATASLDSGKFKVVSATIGTSTSKVEVVSGTGTVLANLSLTAGQVGTAEAGTYAGTTGKVLSVARTRGVVESLHRSGTWRTPDHTTRTTTDGTTVGRCFYIPLRIRRTITFDRIACEITIAGAAGSVARLGLYSSQDGLPTTALYRSLPLDCTVTGEVGETFATPLTVQPGLYFLAVVPQVALPTFRGSATFVEGVSAASFTGTGTKPVIYESGVAGALPSTAAPTTEFGTAPLVAIRAV